MDTEPDGLPTLTSKQTAFVNALLAGKTASDAYRDAYRQAGSGEPLKWPYGCAIFNGSGWIRLA